MRPDHILADTGVRPRLAARVCPRHVLRVVARSSYVAPRARRMRGDDKKTPGALIAQTRGSDPTSEVCLERGSNARQESTKFNECIPTPTDPPVLNLGGAS